MSISSAHCCTSCCAGDRSSTSSASDTAALEEHIFDRPPEPPSTVAARAEARARAEWLRQRRQPCCRTARRPRQHRAAGPAQGPAGTLCFGGAPHRGIGHYLASRPIAARRDHAWYRARKFVGRNRLATAAAALVTIVIAALLCTLTLQARRLQHERDHAQVDRDRADTAAGFLIDVFRSADPALRWRATCRSAKCSPARNTACTQRPVVRPASAANC